MKKKLLFLTGTRADFGKLKPLIRAVHESGDFDYSIFVTGMHLISRYGTTVDEIYKTEFKNIFTYINQSHCEPMEVVLANTIYGLSKYVNEAKPDMLVVHGDRVETLAGSIVGALANILVLHIEGGELSGTVDELIRHAVSKMSHLHFVSNEPAAERLKQMGEKTDSIYVIGSPEIDVMLSDRLPTITAVKERYGLAFKKYGILLYHPVTTERHIQAKNAREVVAAAKESGENYVVIYPNNDAGCDNIFDEYEALNGDPRFKLFPSLRFEYFLSLMKHAEFIIGNSSAGIREAPVFAVPSINIGSRQKNRFHHESIVDVNCDRSEILSAIAAVRNRRHLTPCHHFGKGRCVSLFMEALRKPALWQTEKQKQFCDVMTIAGMGH